MEDESDFERDGDRRILFLTKYLRMDHHTDPKVDGEFKSEVLNSSTERGNSFNFPIFGNYRLG